MSSIHSEVDRPPVEEARFSFSSHMYDWISTVDHKRLGLMYIVSALLFLVIAGVMATVIRLQVAFPNGHVVDPDTFNRLFTMHGTTMVFLVGMPFRRGAFQLSGAVDDWCARYGVSPVERVRILDFFIRRVSSLFQLYWRQRVIWRGIRTRCGLVCLCASYFACFFARRQYRLLDSRYFGCGYWQYRQRDQRDCDHNFHALSRYDSEPHAHVRLGHAD